MKLLIQIFLLIFILSANSISGESGDLPGQELKEISENQEIIEETSEDTEGINTSTVEELLEPKNTEITLPKNRLEEIFDQYFLAELNLDKLIIIGECEKNVADGKCYVVEPSKISNHFNNYYFYTNKLNQVYSIIVFNDKKQGDLNECKEKINLWKDYFNSYDLNEKEPLDNPLNFVLSDDPQQNSLEIFASCYTEKYRDINSSFSIKFYKNI